MCKNGKMTSVETVPGMRTEGIKENDGGVNSAMIHCKNVGKCHKVTPVQKQQ
jgi:hypothetical protein